MRVAGVILWFFLYAILASAGPQGTLLEANLPLYGLGGEWRWMGNYDDHSGNSRHFSVSAGAPIISGDVLILTTNDSLVESNAFIGTNQTALSCFAWVLGTNNIPSKQWYFFSAINFSANARNHGFLKNSTSIGTNSAAFAVYITQNGTINPRKVYVAESSNLFDKWHHIGFVFSASTLTLYLDSVAQTNLFKFADDAMSYINVKTNIIINGAHDNPTLCGNLSFGDCVVAYRALNQDEINELYLKGPPQ